MKIWTKKQLMQAVFEHIQAHGPHVNLNHLDVSALTDFSYVFSLYGADTHQLTLDVYAGTLSFYEHKEWAERSRVLSTFQGDISEWDLSHAVNLQSMFEGSQFNGDISKWNVSKVQNMAKMFKNSHFNQPLTNWDVSSVETMEFMFSESNFNQPLQAWNPIRLIGARSLFEASPFNHSIDHWDITSVTDLTDCFRDCAFDQPILRWNLEKKHTDFMFIDSGWSTKLGIRNPTWEAVKAHSQKMWLEQHYIKSTPDAHDDVVLSPSSKKRL